MQKTFEVVSPVDGALVGAVMDMDAPTAGSMADVVVRAFPHWRATPARERAQALVRFADVIDAHEDTLAALIVAEMGKPIREARGEVGYASGFARTHAADILRLDGHLLPGRDRNHHVEVSYQPVGPVLGITPWNFPAAMVLRTVAPALAAGCTVLLKPAEQTPNVALKLAEYWSEASGSPDAFQVLTCEQPRTVIQHLVTDHGFGKLTFTGSQAVGRELYQLAAGQMMRVSMELGGHAPFIVMPDADVDAAADEIMRSKFRISGQTCVCVNRVLVHQDLGDRLATALQERIGRLITGDPRDESTDVGPLVNKAGYDKVATHVRDAVHGGAHLLAGGSPAGGLWYEPTLLTGVDDSMLIMREETFGPVLPISTFTTEQEAIARANALAVGLAAYVWTRDLGAAHRISEALEAGIIGVNDGIPGGDPSVPFGGFKDSGVGRAGGRWGLQAYLEPQYRSFRLPS